MSTDGTSVGNTKIQNIAIEILEEDEIESVLLAPAIVLQNGETAAAICNTVCFKIESMGDHLTGLRAVMNKLHPDKLIDFDLPERDQMNVRKLDHGHLSSDNSSPATATNDNIAARVIYEAKKKFERDNTERVAKGGQPLPPKEFIVYLKRCWNHFCCTWTENMRKETDKWMTTRFEAEVKKITEDFGDDPFSLDIINFIRLCEKFFCPKGHDYKSDEFDFWAWMRRDVEDDGSVNPRKNVVLMHLERACSGARQDLATAGCPSILYNLPYYTAFILDRKRSKAKSSNGFIKILVKLVPSLEMQSYVRAQSIWHVALVQPHRFLAGTAHDLHSDENGRDCNNNWMGTASMSSVADAIYSALCQLVTDPKKMLTSLS